MRGKLNWRSLTNVFTGSGAKSAIVGMTLIRSSGIPEIGVHNQRIEVHPMVKLIEPEQVLLHTVMLVGSLLDVIQFVEVKLFGSVMSIRGIVSGV